MNSKHSPFFFFYHKYLSTFSLLCFKRKCYFCKKKVMIFLSKINIFLGKKDVEGQICNYMFLLSLLISYLIILYDSLNLFHLFSPLYKQNPMKGSIEIDHLLHRWHLQATTYKETLVERHFSLKTKRKSKHKKCNKISLHQQCSSMKNWCDNHLLSRLQHQFAYLHL